MSTHSSYSRWAVLTGSDDLVLHGTVLLATYLSATARASFRANWVFVTRYRRHIRRGSRYKRKNHSNPRFCIQAGAIGTTPAWKSKAAPTHTWTAAIRSRWS